jgi:STAS domain-containing protein
MLSGPRKLSLNLIGGGLTSTAGVGMLVGLLVSARNRDGELKLASPRKRVKDVLRRTSLPIAWWQDGLSLFIYRPGELPAKISRLELSTGRKTAVERLMQGDPAGVETIGPSCSRRMGRRASMGITGRFQTSIPSI